MLPTCTTWDDQLWARMRAVVDVCVEQELRTAKKQDRSLGPLPPGYPSDRGTFETVFRDLREAVGTRGKRHQEIAHILQRGVVLGDADALIEEIHYWVVRQVDKTPLLTIRFLVHMALLLRQVGAETSTEAFSELLSIYIHMLVNESHASLVATYAAALKATDPVPKYKQLARPSKLEPQRTGPPPSCRTLRKNKSLQTSKPVYLLDSTVFYCLSGTPLLTSS
ncbi:hypothetical protein HPB51_012153 [Rhipicephalus microplus]|uniref:Nuclear pore complex protein n=1 Tax=Rhipicephalus microplus TaxID=6941 RepID=A0A9J6DUH7_RHIMP|nr:hypothetical protein HPB51_012153 [Rhipicephalus microplus]